MRINKVVPVAISVLILASLGVACGGTSAPGDDQSLGEAGVSGTGGAGSSQGGPKGSGTSTSGSSSGDGSDADTTVLFSVPTIEGGGENAAPLQPGCGPETAHECLAPGGGCNSDALLGGDVQVLDAGADCFFEEGNPTPRATVEYITEVNAGEEYVHMRVIFDPDFVDNVYGECSPDFGWNPNRPHTFRDLYKSDHVELLLFTCAEQLALHVKVDFLEEDATASCGYATAGVTGGDGLVVVGDAADVLAVSTSLDRNMNGCGYCEEVDSPCPGSEAYAPSPDAPEWDFRVVYELWVKASAFGSEGFCHSDIDFVHASPAKTAGDTITVEPGDCGPPMPPSDNPPSDGPPGNGDCPINYELFLTSEGEFVCAGPPDEQGVCPIGYVIDLTSEGELCLPG